MKKEGKLVVISGPSGAGKSSLIDDALRGLEGFVRSVSVTTRPKRKNETEGQKYRFITAKEFEKLEKGDKLLECAGYCDFQYGTPRDFVEEKLMEGKNVVLEIEVQGAMQIKKKIKNVFFIFILPPSRDELKKRLSKRNTETPEDIEKRLKTAGEELKYQALYDCIIINNDYNEALLNLKQCLIKAKEL